jgi:hypothetical protein
MCKKPIPGQRQNSHLRPLIPTTAHAPANKPANLAPTPATIMSTPSPTPLVLNQDEQSMDIPAKPPSINESGTRDFTPPPSPPRIQDSITVLLTQKKVHTLEGERWGWWQGYRRDRRVLGFEAPAGKNVVLMVKRGPRKRRRDSD